MKVESRPDLLPRLPRAAGAQHIDVPAQLLGGGPTGLRGVRVARITIAQQLVEQELEVPGELRTGGMGVDVERHKPRKRDQSLKRQDADCGRLADWLCQ